MKRSVWPSRSSAVALAERRDDLLVVAVERRERGVGQAGGEQRGRGAEQGVADLDVGVEEAERPAGLHALQPQADLGQLGGHRVEVDAVDAAVDHVVHGVLLVDDRRLGVTAAAAAGSHRGEPSGDALGGGDEEVPAAASRIADREREQRGLGVGGLFGLVEQGVERGVEQAVDQRRRRVVGAARLALVADDATPA